MFFCCLAVDPETVVVCAQPVREAGRAAAVQGGTHCAGAVARD
jgi:hypothetical protein